MVKNSPANAKDVGSIPESGRSPGEGNSNPLQYSCLGNPMDRGAWRAAVHGVATEPDLPKLEQQQREPQAVLSAGHAPLAEAACIQCVMRVEAQLPCINPAGHLGRLVPVSGSDETLDDTS